MGRMAKNRKVKESAETVWFKRVVSEGFGSKEALEVSSYTSLLFHLCPCIQSRVCGVNQPGIGTSDDEDPLGVHR